MEVKLLARTSRKTDGSFAVDADRVTYFGTYKNLPKSVCLNGISLETTSLGTHYSFKEGFIFRKDNIVSLLEIISKSYDLLFNDEVKDEN